jgi:hypothetical protein
MKVIFRNLTLMYRSLRTDQQRWYFARAFPSAYRLLSGDLHFIASADFPDSITVVPVAPAQPEWKETS